MRRIFASGAAAGSGYSRRMGSLSFVELSHFTQSLPLFFANDDAYRRFQNALMENPERGDVIAGTGGLRKMRWSDARRGKGTRGGIRVIYSHIPERQTIVLMLAYNKNKADDLTTEQRRQLAAIAELTRQELLKP